jgi:hypothetical protein
MSSPSESAHVLIASAAFAKSELNFCSLSSGVIGSSGLEAMWTHEAKTSFSAAIKSCKGLSSSFPISAGTGIVELWAIFTVALLNIVMG